jgi:hypothetical protein
MCHFITAVLPESANLSALAGIAARHGRVLMPQRNPGVEDHLKPGERHFLTTEGFCDCGTTLGSQRRMESTLERSQHQAENAESKLRHKGWSEAKIARWKEQKAADLAKRRSLMNPTNWEDLVKEMLDSGWAPFVGLLLHWYQGPTSSRIELHGREAVPVSAEALARMQEDVLYVFRKEP